MMNSQSVGYIAVFLLWVSGVFTPTFVAAQEESEEPPTLKLDRIPSLPAFAGQTRAPAAKPSHIHVETLLSKLDHPWALAFLPDNEILINENAGNMRILDRQGQLSKPLRGLPAISHNGWGGLFDVALDPDFEANQWVYFSYGGVPDDVDAPSISRVARGRLDKDALRITDVELLLDGRGQQELHFAADKTLLASGAGAESENAAQELSTNSGKLVRINRDGSIPGDNPWSSDSSVAGEIFSYGHRDISGMATHPLTGDIWMTEHGPRGGDEINILHAGANYGWPVISYGTQYSGAPVGDGHTMAAGMQQPLYFWRPSIAPSGLIFYTGSLFADWQGNLLVSALAGQHLSRLVLDGEHVIAEERLLVDRAMRIREVRQGPDGAIYVLTNEEPDAPAGSGQLLRLSPE